MGEMLGRQIGFKSRRTKLFVVLFALANLTRGIESISYQINGAAPIASMFFPGGDTVDNLCCVGSFQAF